MKKTDERGPLESKTLRDAPRLAWRRPELRRIDALDAQFKSRRPVDSIHLS